MRAGALLLLAGVAMAGPFDASPREAFGADAVPGAYERYVESLALLQQALRERPADLRALERAAELHDRFNRAPELIDTVRAALKVPDLATEHRGALRGLLGHLLVVHARSFGGNNFIIRIGPNGNPQVVRQGVTDESKKLLTEAAVHLGEAIRANPKDARSRLDLAEALGLIDEETNANEVKRLRTEAGALRVGERPAPPEPVRYDATAAELRNQAEALEQEERNPDHPGALLLRKRALVLDYCSHTIPFEYEPPLYRAVALLAPRSDINNNLTRSFTKRDGSIGHVSPQYYGATTGQKLELIAGLAKDPGANAAATLLALLTRATRPDPLADAALASLLEGKHAAAREHLPQLLRTALLAADRRRFPHFGTRYLAHLAAAWRLAGAAPVLAAALAEDDDLYAPRDFAAALGAIGRPEDADALLALARDPQRDVYFRRQAIGGLGRIDAQRLDDVPEESYLELALAAARYRAAPTDALRGRIFAALGHEHEADDAARHCVELDLRGAIPQLEQFLATHKDHYAAETVARALATLVARTRGG